MDSFALVDEQFKAGQKLVDRLNAAGIPVTAAAWVKPSNRFKWYLYLVTPLVTEGGATKPAYHQITPVVRELQSEGFWIDPFDVRAFGPTEDTGKAIAELSRRNSPRSVTRYDGTSLGEVNIDGAYIYAVAPAPCKP
jgi:hypothetical protein